MKHVAVVGGGFAGLAAALELASRGLRVTLLEGRDHLGGRAYSFRDEASGEIVDNGQHAMMGCYHHALAFLERIGASHKLYRQHRLHVPIVDASLGTGAVSCLALPSPFHIAGGILRYGLLRRADRARALLAGAQLVRMRRREDPRLKQWTVDQALAVLGQSVEARGRFWTPIVLAMLNESPARACAASLAEVLALALFGRRSDADFVLSRVGLSELYTGDARRAIEARGGRVLLRAPAREILVNDDRVVAICLDDGERIEADSVVVAVPPNALSRVLPQALLSSPGLRHLDRLEFSPIVSVYLWFDRPVLSDDFIGLVGTTTQWLFNRTRITGGVRGSGENIHCVAAVISAGYEQVEWHGDRVRATVLAEIQALIPSARAAKLVHSLVVKERRATISPTPRNEQLRPAAATSITNLFLAGDWVSTGLPPTIESAVTSGQNAARLAAELVSAERLEAA